MKLCDTCIYGSKTEYFKPCIIYRDDCEYYEEKRDDMTDALISRQAVFDALYALCDTGETLTENPWRDNPHIDALVDAIEELPSVNPQEPKTGWNNHQIACMLADLLGDACACNYNGIDEWLPKLCDFKDTCCPNPVGVACWEQFLKYSQSRYTECGYEVRDKGALQEPKTGHWILQPSNKEQGERDFIWWKCSECGQVIFSETEKDRREYHAFCGRCGAKMVEPQESEET